jgi:hypothetical protein
LALQAHYTPQNTSSASAAWLKENGLTPEVLASGSYQATLPKAAASAYEDETEFDSFAPMEVSATATEKTAVLASNNSSAWFFFPEDRRNQVVMTESIPARWAQKAAAGAAASGATVRTTGGSFSNTLAGSAAPGEHFVFQLGVWAARAPLFLDSSNVTWTALASASAGTNGSSGTPIPASAVRCYNTAGIDYRGHAFNQSMQVEQGSVSALWFGVDVPTEASNNNYTGTIMLGDGITFKVQLSVGSAASGSAVPNHGADDAWRMSRLSWLDSTVGIDRNITEGYTPVQVTVNAAAAAVAATVAGNRTVTIATNAQDGGGSGGDSAATATTFPIVSSIVVGEQQMLQSPITFSTPGLSWKSTRVGGGGAPTVAAHDAMAATIVSAATSTDGSLSINATVVVNFDGFVDITVALTQPPMQQQQHRNIAGANANKTLPNATFSFTFPAAASTFFMGLGLHGHNRTASYPTGTHWAWRSNHGGENQLWVGSAHAGLRIKLKGAEQDWEGPLHMQTHPPTESWAGDAGDGIVTAVSAEGGMLVVTASTGAVTVPATAEGAIFKMDLLVTPVKSLNTPRHFRRDRYGARFPAGFYTRGWHWFPTPLTMNSVTHR